MEKFSGKPQPSEEQVAIAKDRLAAEQAENEQNRLINEKIARLRNEAPQKAKTEFESALIEHEAPILKINDVLALDIPERNKYFGKRIAVLKLLMTEFSQTIPGTTFAKDNDNRFIIEEFSEMLSRELGWQRVLSETTTLNEQEGTGEDAHNLNTLVREAFEAEAEADAAEKRELESS